MYQIDQSGKIEDTAKNTVIAYANDRERSLLISRKTKRRIQEAFRQCGAPHLFIYYTFAVGIYYLIRSHTTHLSLAIDTEYPGKDKLIAGMVKRLLEMHRKPAHTISFRRIGNRPNVHYAAHDVFTGKKNADDTLSFEVCIEAIKKTDGRLRECLSTLVGARTRPLKRMVSKNVRVVKTPANKKRRPN